MVNRVMLIGSLGADPELRQTTSGQSVCEMRIATSESWFDKASNERKEKTEWHRIIVWGKVGENCAKYLAKGRKAYIEGRIQTREWEDKQGAKRWTTEIVANNVQFLSSRNDGGGQRQEPASGGGGSDKFDDSEIPF
jgi:single-strand DNA-binding protein